MWPEIKIAKETNRYELGLSGTNLSGKLEENDEKLPEELFDLINLNSLSLFNSTLKEVPENLKHLTNLGMLALQSNEISVIPESIGNLQKLTYLDISDNNISSLTSSVGELVSLQTFNASRNNLKTVPNFKKCTHLIKVNLGHNEIESFQEICCTNFSLLNEIHLENNSIKVIPIDVEKLCSLKTLNLDANKIKEVSKNILNAPKLKDLSLKENPLNDKRFKKLVDQDRTLSKQVLDYIRKNCKEIVKSQVSESSSEVLEPEPKHKSSSHELSVVASSDETIIYVTNEVKEVRPFMVACILRGLSLQENKFKKFITLQTKLHESICDRRCAATIATHDVRFLKRPLYYRAMGPSQISIHPLGYKQTLSAKEFYKRLSAEAERTRKALKRNCSSGIHKYINLVKNWSMWPILEDADKSVISLPPLTNSDITKMSTETTDILIEVTSSLSLWKCKEVMEALLLEIFEAGLSEQKTESSRDILKVEPVRVLDHDNGNLRVLYPSKVDLSLGEKITVIRE